MKTVDDFFDNIIRLPGLFASMFQNYLLAVSVWAFGVYF